MTDYDAMIVAKTTIKKRWFGIIVSGIIFAIILVAVLAPVVYSNLPTHAKARLEIFLDPESDPRGSRI